MDALTEQQKVIEQVMAENEQLRTENEQLRVVNAAAMEWSEHIKILDNTQKDPFYNLTISVPNKAENEQLRAENAALKEKIIQVEKNFTIMKKAILDIGKITPNSAFIQDIINQSIWTTNE